jgi:hypothetical protein
VVPWKYAQQPTNVTMTFGRGSSAPNGYTLIDDYVTQPYTLYPNQTIVNTIFARFLHLTQMNRTGHERTFTDMKSVVSIFVRGVNFNNSGLFNNFTISGNPGTYNVTMIRPVNSSSEYAEPCIVSVTPSVVNYNIRWWSLEIISNFGPISLYHNTTGAFIANLTTDATRTVKYHTCNPFPIRAVSRTGNSIAVFLRFFGVRTFYYVA